jgi:hypothetical protein
MTHSSNQSPNTTPQRSQRLRSPGFWLGCMLGLVCSACLDEYSKYDFVEDAGADKTAARTAPTDEAPVASAPSAAPSPAGSASSAPANDD